MLTANRLTQGQERMRSNRSNHAPDDMITQEEAARRLGWSKEAFRHARYEGRLKGLKIYRFGHKTLRVSAADLEQFIREQAVQL